MPRERAGSPRVLNSAPRARTARRCAPGFRSAAGAARRPRSRRGWCRETRLPATPSRSWLGLPKCGGSRTETPEQEGVVSGNPTPSRSWLGNRNSLARCWRAAASFDSRCLLVKGEGPFHTFARTDDCEPSSPSSVRRPVRGGAPGTVRITTDTVFGPRVTRFAVVSASRGAGGCRRNGPDYGG